MNSEAQRFCRNLTTVKVANARNRNKRPSTWPPSPFHSCGPDFPSCCPFREAEENSVGQPRTAGLCGREATLPEVLASNTACIPCNSRACIIRPELSSGGSRFSYPGVYPPSPLGSHAGCTNAMWRSYSPSWFLCWPFLPCERVTDPQ